LEDVIDHLRAMEERMKRILDRLEEPTATRGSDGG
jgi:hypothetical protein